MSMSSLEKIVLNMKIEVDFMAVIFVGNIQNDVDIVKEINRNMFLAT